MHRLYTHEIDGDLDAVYRLLVEVAAWPDLFPHVESAEVLWSGADARVVRVRASRSGVPVTWICRRRADPGAHGVAVEHIDGFARGLRATWALATLPARRTRVRLTVDHHPPGVVGWLTPVVIDYLATHTIAMLSLLAESDRDAHERQDV